MSVIGVWWIFVRGRVPPQGMSEEGSSLSQRENEEVSRAWTKRRLTLVPQRFVLGKHVLHAFLGFRFAAEADEGFTFEVKHLLFGDQS